MLSTKNALIIFEDKKKFTDYLTCKKDLLDYEGFLHDAWLSATDDNFHFEFKVYIDTFLRKYNLDINFKNPKDLKKIDSVLNTMSFREIRENYMSIAVIIGEFGVSNIKGTGLYRFWLNKIRVPLVVMTDRYEGVLQPFTVLFDEYNAKKNKPKHKINTYKYLQDAIEDYHYREY